MNNKQDRQKFVNEVTAIIVGLNPTNICKNFEGKFAQTEYYIPVGDNHITLIVRDQSQHDILFSVFGFFQKVVVGFGNQSSGKHNFHTSSNCDYAIMEFKNFIDEIIKTCIPAN